MKTFHSTLGTAGTVPSLSLVLLCRLILVQVLLSRTDQPAHSDPSESDFLLRKLQKCKHTVNTCFKNIKSTK